MVLFLILRFVVFVPPSLFLDSVGPGCCGKKEDSRCFGLGEHLAETTWLGWEVLGKIKRYLAS